MKTTSALGPNMAGHVEKEEKSLQQQNELEDAELTILCHDERKGRHRDVRDQRERRPKPKRKGIVPAVRSAIQSA